MSRFHLITRSNGLQLKDAASRQKPLRVDFASPALHHRLRHGGKKELLLKAVGVTPGWRVVDCTAGLGVDAFLLAAAGCHVTLLERSPVLVQLLKDGLARGREDDCCHDIVARMSLVQTDAADWLAEASEVDAIYIDQMFPARQKSAAVKGAMQVLQRFVGEQADRDSLLDAALQVGCRRIVVKCPAQGGGSTRHTPAWQLKARSSRFDVYLP